MNDEERSFYATPGVMTDVTGYEEVLAGLPTAPREVAQVVQGLVLHIFWAAAYQVSVPAERVAETQVRSAARMLRRALELDPRPLVQGRPPGDRFVGNCRHFSTLTVALLRYLGVPSRARCGFASYFEPGKWCDHWVVEYRDGARWVTMDSQVDAVQQRLCGLQASPADLPPGLFLPAGEAWARCQRGEEEGDRFGVLDEWGQWFIKGNVVRDLAALNKVEMLPWDDWSSLSGANGTSTEADVDEVAALTTSGDFDAIRSRYLTDPDLRVPRRVRCHFPVGAEPDVAELAELTSG
jgi:hypothetical protein